MKRHEGDYMNALTRLVAGLALLLSAAVAGAQPPGPRGGTPL
jgi:hypothetical protein